jgi:hypothetical protein
MKHFRHKFIAAFRKHFAPNIRDGQSTIEQTGTPDFQPILEDGDVDRIINVHGRCSSISSIRNNLCPSKMVRISRLFPFIL